MSNIKANPPINLAELSPRLAASKVPGDEWLADDELQALSIFAGLKKKIDFRGLPGATYLWHGTVGRVLCVQGDAGSTAFYVVTPAEVLGLRQRQLALLQQFVKAAPDDPVRKNSHLAGMTLQQLTELESRYAKEIAAFQAQPGASDEASRPPVLSAHVLPVEEQRARTKGGWWRSLLGRARPAAAKPADAQQYIPVDAPVAIDVKQRCGTLFAGDLFGEMSCMNRAPRSATVVVEQECYILEMARSVFEWIRRDPVQKKRLDEAYRERLLGTFLERLAFFAGVDRALLAPLVPVAELKTYEAGALVFEQDDSADAVYIVRSGLAKVIQNVGAKLRARDFTPFHWAALRQELAEGARPGGPLVDYVRSSLGANFQQALAAVVDQGAAAVASEADAAVDGEGAAAVDGEKAAAAAICRTAVDALNAFICQDAVPQQFGKTTPDAVDAVKSHEFAQLAVNFPDKVENWSDVERRLFFRLLLEAACPVGAPKRLACYGPMRTLAYRNQGEVIGEMGVFLDKPRNATCVAYDHPDGRLKMRVPDSRTGAVPSQLELIKIHRDDFMKVLKSSAELSDRVKQIVETRGPTLQADAGPRTEKGWSLRNLPEFEELGLVQGQRLMVIDLDRCTRCGECVKACIAVHDDGHSRLYLDGPRFGDYLAPISCRKCLDPVCMIGCPVSAIHRGEIGEIRIRDWCIGCSMCANQCPYGSIHMTPLEGELNVPEPLLELLEQETELMKVNKRAVVCDLCASTNLGREACVHACPHDAAMRVNGMQFSFERQA
jgi:Fe-S-cluster-containing dehydrogenase component/CRP-like cAMP-binding protein